MKTACFILTCSAITVGSQWDSKRYGVVTGYTFSRVIWGDWGDNDRNMITLIINNTEISLFFKENFEIVRETTLLGTVITDRLTWDRNTEELVKK